MQIAPHELRRGVFEKIGRIAQTIASPARLKLIQLLAQGPKSVETLSEGAGESVANTSQHLQRLLRDGLVKVRKEGLNRVYSIANPHLLGLWEEMQNLAHEVAPELDEIEVQLTDQTLRSKLSAQEIVEMARQKKLVVVDVRDETESSATPVPFALRMPFEQLMDRKDELRKSTPIILFCRGRYCSLASHAVRELRAAGYKAYRVRESAYVLNKIWEKK